GHLFWRIGPASAGFCVLLLDFPSRMSEYPGRTIDSKGVSSSTRASVEPGTAGTAYQPRYQAAETVLPAKSGALMSSKVPTAFRLISLNLLLAFGLNAASQTANLSGAVKDSSGAVVVRATVSISRESTGLKRTTRSSEQGFYRFAFLLPGLYTITAKAAGFGTVSSSGVKLDPGQEA